MIQIGLTGGIGSGKSTVAQLLRIMGYPVYDSDLRSKQLCDEHPDLRKQLAHLLGPGLYANNRLDRAYMAQQIFRDNTLLKQVNALIHPVVSHDYLAWTALHDTCELVFQETAILFEAGLQDRYDAILLVVAPEQLRIQRVCARSGMSPEQVMQRIQNQWPVQQCVEQSDFVLINDDIQAIIPQVMDLLSQIKQIE
ncbi:MAG: dephospho-CoA kinase [Bacteroidales bacterium]|nr:dephospho-CoA kinase [Bacteroidales bacterium]